MELSPNIIYKNPSTMGGIPVSNPDIMDIFCDFSYKVFIHQSMFSLPKRVTGSSSKHYTLSAPEAMKINRTHVLARGIRRDLTKIYLYDLNIDSFICVAHEEIRPYGDVASMEGDGGKSKNRIMGHAQRVKAFKNHSKTKSSEIDGEIEKLMEMEENFIDLKEIV